MIKKHALNKIKLSIDIKCLSTQNATSYKRNISNIKVDI